jgi:hypothetical protein
VSWRGPCAQRPSGARPPDRGEDTAHKRKSWAEKLQDSKGFPKTIRYSPELPCAKALGKQGTKPGDRVVLAPPLEVREVMSTVPRGELITLSELCRRLARKHGADYCCTLTAGIFVRTAANASEETGGDLPYWRTLKNTGELNPKFPGGLLHRPGAFRRSVGLPDAQRRAPVLADKRHPLQDGRQLGAFRARRLTAASRGTIVAG